MADPVLTVRHPFDGVAVPGRYGRASEGDAPLVVTPRQNLRMTQITARRGQAAALSDAILAALGLMLPDRPKSVAADGVSLIGIASEQWLAVAEGDPAAQRLARLESALLSLASLVDQSDGKAVLRISGPAARDTLAKGCMIDLHTRAFKPGDVATTQISLTPCHLWQLDEAPTYELAVATSYARSFWGWLTASAAEYGFSVALPD